MATARGPPKPSPFMVIWATFYASPFWWLVFGTQMLVLILVTVITGAFTLLTTLFGSFVRVITSYRFVLFFAILFLAFFFMHKYASYSSEASAD